MEPIATTLTAIRAELPAYGRAAATRFIGPASEPVCSLCGGTGLRQCECVKARVRAARLAAIPELFKTSTFEFYHPHNQRQERALALMRGKSIFPEAQVQLL